MAVTIHRPPPPLSDAEIAPWRKIPVAVAVDFGGGQIDPAIRALRPPGLQPPLIGRAVTALCEPPDFGAVLYALEQVGPGHVLVIAAGGVRDFAMIGEILCGYLRGRGAAGVVCDGAVRDVATLAGFDDFSVFTRWVTPRGPTGAERGAVNVAVEIGATVVSPGDLILGDDDGLVALTPEYVRTRMAEADAKVAKEAEWIAGLEAGKSVAQMFGLSPSERT
jgi:regulator of RNase E activity RraA